MREGALILWAFGEDGEEVELHAGIEDLGVDEASRQIEERARPPARHAAGQRKAARPAPEIRAGHKPVMPGRVARIGARLDPQNHLPKPLYLRGPDAKPQTGFAVSRA